MLLALEAHRRSPQPSTEQAVFNALGSAAIPSRVAAFSGIDTGSCPTPVLVRDDGRVGYGWADGLLQRIDLDTGTITTEREMDEQCGVWLMDSDERRSIVGAVSAQTVWFGTREDLFAIRVDFDQEQFLVSNTIDGGIASFISDATGALSFYDVDTGEQIGDRVDPQEYRIVKVDPSGAFIAASGQLFDSNQRGRMFVLDGETGVVIHTVETDSAISAVFFDFDRLQILAGLDDGRVVEVDLVTGALGETYETGSTSFIGEVNTAPDGSIVVITGGEAKVIDRQTGFITQAIELRNVQTGDYRDDGSLLVGTAGNDWEVVSLVGANVVVERAWPADPFGRVAFNDGMASVLNESTQSAEIVDLSTGERTSLDFTNPDGSRFVANAMYPETNGAWVIDAAGTIARWEDGEQVEHLSVPGRFFTGTRFEDRWGVIVGLDPDPDAVQEAWLVDLISGRPQKLFAVPAIGATGAHPSIDGGLHVIFEESVRTYGPDGQLVGEISTEPNSLSNTIDAQSGLLAVNGPRGGVVVIDTDAGKWMATPTSPWSTSVWLDQPIRGDRCGRWVRCRLGSRTHRVSRTCVGGIRRRNASIATVV